jgi:hypothetical protein
MYALYTRKYNQWVKRGEKGRGGREAWIYVIT